MFVFEIIHVPYLTCCSSRAKVLKSCDNQHHHSAFFLTWQWSIHLVYPFLMYRSIHPKNTNIQSGTSPKLSHGTSRCLIQVGYLTMWNRPIYEVLGCWLWFSPKQRYTGCIGMSIIGLLLVVQVTYILSTLQCRAVALFLIQTCVFGGRHWSSKNASKSCCLVMKGELGSPICRCPKRVGGILFMIFQHCKCMIKGL